MNIDDAVVDNVEVPAGQWLDFIFAHQSALMAKYEDIERANGAIIPEQPWNIDHRTVQYRIKDMFWRATEEIAEALEEIPPLHHWKTQWEADHRIRHLFEELADSIHFITEATILAGITPAELKCSTEMTFWKVASQEIRKGSAMTDSLLLLRTMDLVRAMGLAANCLKNKPWKNTPMLTDRLKFKQKMVEVWEELTGLCMNLGMSPQEVYVLYLKKNHVNQFRQNTNY